MMKYAHSIFLAALCLMIYGYAVASAQFIAIDDFSLIVDNPFLRSLSVHSFKGMFSTYDPDLYLPITLLSYHIDRIIGGGFSPLIVHCINLLLHIVNTFLVVKVIRIVTGRAWIGFVTALLFAVHPIQVETVMWASARKDLLATLFFLVSWLLYLQNNKFSIVTFALGLMSKVSIIGFPIILVLTDWYKGKSINKRYTLSMVPYFLLSTLFGVVALFGIEGESLQGTATMLLASRSIVFYLQHIFLPTDFSVLVPYYDSVNWTNVALLTSFVCILIITAIAFLSRVRVAIFSWTLFVIALIPSFGNFVRGNEYPLNIYLASDRYAYIACLAVFILFAYLVEKWKWRNILVGFIVCTLVPISFIQAKTWKDTPSVLIHSIEVYPHSHVARNALAAMLIENGHSDIAMQELQKSLSYRDSAQAYYLLGYIAEHKGQTDAAVKLYNQALEVNPYLLEGFIALAKISAREGRASAAQMYIRNAETFYPDNKKLAEVREELHL